MDVDDVDLHPDHRQRPDRRGVADVWWFLAAAAGPDAYRIADAVITSWFGDLVMFLSLAALWYHMLAGMRHLIWDTGRMMQVGTRRAVWDRAWWCCPSS